jgi:transposase
LNDHVMIAVDPHKASNTAAVLDPVPETVIESARFANTTDGYAQLTAFAGRWSQRRWAVEGCFGAGRSLAQRLVADGEMVLDVPAKLAARVRVYSRGHGRKTDKHDAVSAGLAALDGTGVLPVAGDDALVSLRLLCDRRDELAAQRTQAVCRLHRPLAELTPGGMRRELSANKAQALLALIRPADDVGRVRVHIARDHLADIRALDARITYIGIQIAALVTASGTGLTAPFGIGPVIAGRLLAEVGDVARFATKDAFASYNGTAPTGRLLRRPDPPPALARREPADQSRPAHDGRHPDPLPRHPRPPVLRTQADRGQDLQRSAAVRRLSDLVYYQLLADQRGTIGTCGSPTTPPPTPSASTSPASRSHRAAPPSRPAPRRPSPDSSRSTGKTTASSASRSSTPAPGSTPISSRKPKSSAKTSAS